MNLYSYKGPVLLFDQCIANRWKACTYAASENKARNNLAYQFKKEHGKLVNTKIVLPGKLVVGE